MCDVRGMVWDGSHGWAPFTFSFTTPKIYAKLIPVVSRTDDRCCDTERPQERKVRASQGRVPDNVWRRRLQGQCNRNIPPIRGFGPER